MHHRFKYPTKTQLSRFSFFIPEFEKSPSTHDHQSASSKGVIIWCMILTLWGGRRSAGRSMSSDTDGISESRTCVKSLFLSVRPSRTLWTKDNLEHEMVPLAVRFREVCEHLMSELGQTCISLMQRLSLYQTILLTTSVKSVPFFFTKQISILSLLSCVRKIKFSTFMGNLSKNHPISSISFAENWIPLTTSYR